MHQLINENIRVFMHAVGIGTRGLLRSQGSACTGDAGEQPALAWAFLSRSSWGLNSLHTYLSIIPEL
jgi:hypothetical protein